MNSPPAGRTPVSRTPLRVYLAGDDDDPTWRLSVLRYEAHEAFAVAAQSGGSIFLQDALPYGHTYVGPFTLRPSLDDAELAVAAGLEVQRTDKYLGNPERTRLSCISKADIVFCWYVGRKHLDVGIELGTAYASGKAVILASTSQDYLEQLPLATEIAWKMFVGSSPRDAYERATADLDLTFERGMAKIESKYDGRCTVCHASYHPGDIIYWSKPRGGMHPDCYARINDPKEISSAVFNSELVNALRSENAKLEKECLDLMTKNSLLEKESEELYLEYQKAVEGR